MRTHMKALRGPYGQLLLADGWEIAAARSKDEQVLRALKVLFARVQESCGEEFVQSIKALAISASQEVISIRNHFSPIRDAVMEYSHLMAKASSFIKAEKDAVDILDPLQKKLEEFGCLVSCAVRSVWCVDIECALQVIVGLSCGSWQERMTGAISKASNVDLRNIYVDKENEETLTSSQAARSDFSLNLQACAKLVLNDTGTFRTTVPFDGESEKVIAWLVTPPENTQKAGISTAIAKAMVTLKANAGKAIVNGCVSGLAAQLKPLPCVHVLACAVVLGGKTRMNIFQLTSKTVGRLLSTDHTSPVQHCERILTTGCCKCIADLKGVAFETVDLEDVEADKDTIKKVSMPLSTALAVGIGSDAVHAAIKVKSDLVAASEQVQLTKALILHRDVAGGAKPFKCCVDKCIGACDTYNIDSSVLQGIFTTTGNAISTGILDSAKCVVKKLVTNLTQQYAKVQVSSQFIPEIVDKATEINDALGNKVAACLEAPVIVNFRKAYNQFEKAKPVPAQIVVALGVHDGEEPTETEISRMVRWAGAEEGDVKAAVSLQGCCVVASAMWCPVSKGLSRPHMLDVARKAVFEVIGAEIPRKFGLMLGLGGGDDASAGAASAIATSSTPKVKTVKAEPKVVAGSGSVDAAMVPLGN